MNPTREQVIEMAMAAGAAKFYPDKQSTVNDAYLVSRQFLERFAVIVHAAARAQALKEAKAVINAFPHWIGPTAKAEICAAIEALKGKQ